MLRTLFAKLLNRPAKPAPRSEVYEKLHIVVHISPEPIGDLFPPGMNRGCALILDTEKNIITLIVVAQGHYVSANDVMIAALGDEVEGNKFIARTTHECGQVELDKVKLELISAIEEIRTYEVH